MNKELTPQDRSINHHIPLFFYEIYEREDGFYGHLVNWKPAWEAEKDYVVVYRFKGQQAYYWIGSQDASVLRKDALLFAISIHENKCRVFHCDLSEINKDYGKRK